MEAYTMAEYEAYEDGRLTLADIVADVFGPGHTYEKCSPNGVNFEIYHQDGWVVEALWVE